MFVNYDYLSFVYTKEIDFVIFYDMYVTNTSIKLSK